MTWAELGGFAVAIVGGILAAPFFFDRMGWRFPFAPPLPAPHIPFKPGSDEMKELLKAISEAASPPPVVSGAVSEEIKLLREIRDFVKDMATRTPADAVSEPESEELLLLQQIHELLTTMAGKEAPRVPFGPESEELQILRKSLVYAEASGNLALIQVSDKSQHTLPELFEMFDQLTSNI